MLQSVIQQIGAQSPEMLAAIQGGKKVLHLTPAKSLVFYLFCHFCTINKRFVHESCPVFFFYEGLQSAPATQIHSLLLFCRCITTKCSMRSLHYCSAPLANPAAFLAMLNDPNGAAPPGQSPAVQVLVRTRTVHVIYRALPSDRGGAFCFLQ